MTLHPTSHPQIVFVGGNLFTNESNRLFDGLLVFTGGFTGLQVLAKEAERNGSIPCPYRIHADASGGELAKVIQEDLDYLAGEGCRKIGMHAPNFVDDARISIEAAKEWLAQHPDAVDTIYFVDARDDYFNCFGTEI